MIASIPYRRWVWPAVAGLALALAVLVPRIGYTTPAPTPLWSERALPVAPAPVTAPNWVELAKASKPAVVNISTKRVEEGMPGLPGFAPDDQFQQFFRRFAPRGPRTVRSLGSGFVINASGYIVTNNHVIDKATEIHVKLAAGASSWPRSLAATPRRISPCSRSRRRACP